MNVIETNQLTKTYRRFRKQEGILGSVKGLFHRDYEEKQAVSQMDLSVRGGEFVGLIAVSYTHLDVYKRQVWRKLAYYCAASGFYRAECGESVFQSD